jgi:hypothetical protein
MINTGKISDGILFSTTDGKELGRLDDISEIQLECPEDYSEKEKRYLKGYSQTFECTGDSESFVEFTKQVIFGGNRGRYNAYVLRRDGYLSPENGWLDCSNLSGRLIKFDESTPHF